MKGAQPTETARSILARFGVKKKVHERSMSRNRRESRVMPEVLEHILKGIVRSLDRITVTEAVDETGNMVF